MDILDKNYQTLKMNMVETVNWTLKDDGYYYFNETLSPQNKVALCSYVFIDESTQLQTNTKYIVTVCNEKEEVVAFGLALPGFGKALQKSGGRLTIHTIVKLKWHSNPLP